MNYYIHNIGDYAIETKFMTFEEKGIFVDMVDQYLATGMPLASDWLANLKRVASDNTVNAVLSAHFVQDGDCWRSQKLDDLIASYDKRAEKNRNNARRGRAKANAINDLQNNDTRKATGLPVASESLPSRSQPLTINHKPLIEREKERAPAKPTRTADANTPTPTPKRLTPPEGIPAQAWSDWMQVRGNAPVTKSFWKDFCNNADKLHLTPAKAVELCAQRGWKRLDADWESVKVAESNEDRLLRLMGEA